MRSRRWLSVFFVVLMVLTTVDITAYAQGVEKSLQISSQISEDVMMEEAANLKTSSNEEVTYAQSSALSNPRIESGVTTWDCVWFGQYWQNDTNGDGKADVGDEKEPIKWRVLNVENDVAMLISDQIITYRSWNGYTADSTWDTSDIRRWLNSYSDNDETLTNSGFLYDAFSDYEKTLITVKRDDQVTLLELDDVSNANYGFIDDNARKAVHTNFAAYIKSQDSRWQNLINKWWLNSRVGKYDCRYVQASGEVYNRSGFGVDHIFGIRPVLFLDVSQGEYLYAGTVTSTGIMDESNINSPTIFFTFETNNDIEYNPANGYNYTSFDLDIGALCMVPVDNSNPTYENVKVTIELPEGLSFSATEVIKTATKELGTMSLTGTARQDMTFTVYPDNSYETRRFEVKASVTADGYEVANTDTFTIDVKTLVNYDEYELLVYAEYSDCTFGIGQTMALIPAMVKDGEPLEGEEGWSYSIKDTSVAEITKYTETEYAPAPTITGNKAGTTVLTVVHVPTGRSVDLYLTIVEEHKVHNIKSLEQLPEGYAIYNAGMYIDEFSTEKSGSEYNVKFNVYNGLQCHGAVEVYNSAGQIIDIERIDKFDRYQTGLVDVLASLGNLICTTADGTLSSYRNKLYAEETKIEVSVPDGGYIIVSNNVTESIGAYIYNGVDLAFWAYTEGTDIAKELKSEEQSDAIIESASKSVAEQYLNAVKTSVITDTVENNLQKKLYDSINKDFATDMVEGFGQTFINNSNEFFVELDIDLWSELKKSAISYGDSTIVKAFEKVGGPAGIALSGIFKTNEYLNVFMQLVDMEKTRDIEGLRVNIDVDDDKLVSNNVIVENAQGLPIANNELVVVDISKKSESQYILEEFSRASQIRIYDITMYRDDKEVQPDGSIRVKIPVPALYNQEKCAIYRAEKDGSYTNMNAHYEDGYIVFVTTHLSTYVLVEEAPMTLNAPTIAKVSNASTGIQISWNKVADATYYNVYRSTSKTGSFTMIKSNVAAVSYVDTSATAGKTYYYKVVAGNDKIKSDYSAVSVGLICLKAPTFKKIVNVVSGVHVYWNASSGAKTYNVYRSTNKTSGYMLIKKGLTATHYIDTSAVSGITYYYKVVATNGTTTSVYSAPFNAITYVGTPDITSRANSAYGVRLGWNKISGATGYAIYRKPYDGNTWVRVTTIKGNSTFTWTDSSVKTNNGTVYKYTIRALAGSNMKTLSGCRSTGRTMTRLTSRTLNSAVKTSATSIKCNWTTTSVCNGYEVRFMVGSTVYKTFTVGNYKTGVKTFTGLKAGQTYKVQVRSYKKVEGVGTFYSAWSTEKMVML